MIEGFHEDIIKKEIDGKIQAIHEYDNMLWKLRIGFLTLFFTGWGLMLKSLIENTLIENINILLLLMTSLSFVICIGGFAIDLNYIKRKYRVIYALDLLYAKIFSGEPSENFKPEHFKDLIQISGSKANNNYSKVTGYKGEFIVNCLIYLLPVVSMVVGVGLLWK